MANSSIRRAALLVFVSLLSACSTIQFAYNNAQTAVRFMVTDYVDFDSAQYEDFKSRFTQFHEWHRSQELPAYAGLLRVAAGRIQRGLNEDDVRWAVGTVRMRYRLAAARVAGEAAPMLVAMAPAQLVHIEKTLAEKNAKFEKENITADVRGIFKKRAGQMKDNFEEWVGNLTDAQEERIERFVKSQSDLTALRFADRKRWQREAMAAIRAQRDPALLAVALTDLLAHPEKGRQPAVNQALLRYDEGLIDLVMDIDRSLSAEQRAKASKRMHKYADDFTELSGGRVTDKSS